MEFTSNGEVTVQEYIWFTLIDSLNNPFAAAAMMGWIYSISRFDTRFVDTNLIDADAYTRSVDSPMSRLSAFPYSIDVMKEFRIDNVGYGIVGWKDWIEKQGLWCMARRNAASISDLRTQMQLLVSTFDESRHYDAIMHLMNSESLEEAVNIVVKDYDGTSENVEGAIHSAYIFAKDFYSKYSGYIQKKKNKTGKMVIRINRRIAVRKSANILGKKIGVAKEGNTYPFLGYIAYGRWACIEYSWSYGYIPASPKFCSLETIYEGDEEDVNAVD